MLHTACRLQIQTVYLTADAIGSEKLPYEKQRINKSLKHVDIIPRDQFKA